MSTPLLIPVKESESELKRHIRGAKTPTQKSRLKISVEIKKSVAKGISGRDLSDKTKLNHNTVQLWRKLYVQEGTAAFLEDGGKGFSPSGITVEEHAAVGAGLNAPYNGLQGYM